MHVGSSQKAQKPDCSDPVQHRESFFLFEYIIVVFMRKMDEFSKVETKVEKHPLQIFFAKVGDQAKWVKNCQTETLVVNENPHAL